MSEEGNSVNVQPHKCEVVLSVSLPDGKLKCMMIAAGSQVKKVARKVVRYLNKTWLHILLGLWLTAKAIDAAYEFRGYEAVGSEYLILPMLLLIVEMCRKAFRFIGDCREEW